MQRFLRLGFGLLLFALTASAWAQGVLIVVDPPMPTPLPRPIIYPPPRPHFTPPPPPQPPMTYKIKELSVQARVQDQVGRVQVSQSFVNTGSRQMEVSFVFPLPYDGAVDQLTFMVDGKEYPAKLLPAAEARSVYEGYVRRNQDPALLEWIGTGMFKTSVFPVPPGAERKVTLRYNQLLRKDGRVTDFLFPLSTAKYTSTPIEKLSIQASIESAIEIKSVYSPTHPIDVQRPDDKHATVKFEVQNQVPATDFRLFFDNAAGKVGASVLAYRPNKDDDGFFLLLASPEIKSDSAERPSKTTIIAVDRSGSMAGKKIDQVKEALKFVLNNLRDGDTFNIIAYDSSVESFRPELQRYNEESRKAALGFVEGIYAGGSTNIDGALSAALNMIHDASRPSYIVFLTDGLPTAGETNEAKIVDRARQNNKYRARLITLGVGYDVNSRLLDRLCRENSGQTEFVRPDENLEAHVSRLYNRISAPVMTELSVTFDLEGAKPEGGPPVNRVYPREVRDLFAGEQLVLAGRYKRPGNAKVVVKGKVAGKEQKFDFPANLIEQSKDESYAFVEKLWAMRRIGEIIDEIDLKGKNDELVKELVALSTKHGILTPYTSFLADENVAPRQLASAGGIGMDRAREALRRLDDTGGIAGFAQRSEIKRLQEARLAAPAADYGMRMGGARAAAKPAAPGAGPSTMARTTPGAPARTLPLNAGAFGGGAVGGVYRNIDTDEEVAVDTVQNVGGETLYKRGKQWFAANARDVDLERDKAKVKTVERFSDEYFKLVKANTASENAVLAAQKGGEELIIKLRGQVYLIR
jgi:Ca-activated chloride channel family protein